MIFSAEQNDEEKGAEAKCGEHRIFTEQKQRKCQQRGAIWRGRMGGGKRDGVGGVGTPPGGIAQL